MTPVSGVMLETGTFVPDAQGPLHGRPWSPSAVNSDTKRFKASKLSRKALFRLTDLVFLCGRVRNFSELIRCRASGRVVVLRLRNGASVAVQTRSSDMLALREVILRNRYPLARPQYGLVVDIGAHVGLFTARICARASRVVAFEPTQRNFKLLQTYCRSPRQNLEVHRLAITSDGRVVKIRIHPYNTGQHSLFEHSVTAAEVEEVASIASTDLLRFLGASCVDLLKIDVEGAEYEICDAAAVLLSATREIIIEANRLDEERAPARVHSMLEDAGFRVSRVWSGDQQAVFHGVKGLGTDAPTGRG
jgi:FkbM family methyltransferase